MLGQFPELRVLRRTLKQRMGPWGRSKYLDDRFKLGRMRPLLGDLKQQSEYRLVFKLELIADQPFEPMLGKQIAIGMQPSRGHDKQPRHAGCMASGIKNRSLKINSAL